MYAPAQFALSEIQSWDVVTEAAAGHLVIASATGLRSVFVPILADHDQRSITAHVARANAWWRDAHDGDEVVGLFTLAHSYVSPSLYPGKADDPAVVPTWDYVQVEARGTVLIKDDPDYVEDVVRRLSDHMEAGRAQPWSIDDTPRAYIEKMRRAIVGIEVCGVTVTGAAKLSQNKTWGDRDGVHDAFAAGSGPEREVAALMEREW